MAKTADKTCLYVTNMLDAGVRILIQLGDEPDGVYMMFPTADLAWGAVDALTEQVVQCFGPRSTEER